MLNWREIDFHRDDVVSTKSDLDPIKLPSKLKLIGASHNISANFKITGQTGFDLTTGSDSSPERQASLPDILNSVESIGQWIYC